MSSNSSSSSNTGLIVGIVAITVLIFGGLAAAIYFAPSTDVSPQTDEHVSFNDVNAPSVGDPNAKVVVHMYEDLQCPACRLSEPGLKAAIAQFSNRVRFVWKDFPLSTIHTHARLAANAARCAEDQNAFWSYHDTLYDKQSDWEASDRPQDLFSQYARDLGLNGTTFDACLNSSKDDAKISADMSEGDANAVDSTPTYFIQNRRYHGMTADQWAQLLNDALSKVATTTTMTTTSTPSVQATSSVMTTSTASSTK